MMKTKSFYRLPYKLKQKPCSLQNVVLKSLNQKKEKGVFKTYQGKFLVNILKKNRIYTISQHETRKEAEEKYKEYV